MRCLFQSGHTEKVCYRPRAVTEILDNRRDTKIVHYSNDYSAAFFVIKVDLHTLVLIGVIMQMQNEIFF